MPAGGEARPPDYLLRWNNSIRREEGGRLKCRTSVRASLRFPKITDRLRPFFSGENEAEPEVSWPREPEGGYSPAFAQTFRLEVVFLGSEAGRPGEPGTP